MKWGVAAVLLAIMGSPLTLAERPNVIVFFVDDLGWTDLGCFGSDFYETPSIDQLAANGVRFTQAYAACTVCSPSRAALLTGKSPARLHVTDFIPGHAIENTPLLIPDWTQRLEREHVTIAELLQEAGYHTAHIGKWHLTPRDRNDDPNDDGNYPQFYPQQQGYDVNIGGCERGAPASYFWPYGRGATLEERRQNNTFNTIPASAHEQATADTYLTDQLADEAVRLLAKFDQDPFFLSFSFYNVHTPLQGRQDLVKKYRQKLQSHPRGRHQNPVYAAMVESMDQAVGRVLQQLSDQGVSDRTLVILTSDNGGLAPRATSNHPLRQGKGSIYEGGVRVPAIVTWPGVTRKNAVCSQPMITMDIFPTIMQATETAWPAGLQETIDGLSLLPLLKNPESAVLERTALYWHYPHYHMMGGIPHSTIRAGNWKLIERHGGSVELYHLAEDIHEDHDLAADRPDRVNQLRQQLQAWRESVGAQMPVANPQYDPAVGPVRRGRGRLIPMDPVRR